MEETTEDNRPSLKDSVINNGLILGAIHSLAYVLLYFMIPSKITGFSYLFFIILLNIGYSIFRAVTYRSAIGGFLDFGDVFKLTFLTLLVSGLLGSLIVPIAISLVDSGFSEVMAQSQFDTSVYWAEKFGAPQETIDQMREKMDMEELKKSYSLAKLAIGFGIAAIFYCIAGVIVGFIARKSQPEEM